MARCNNCQFDNVADAKACARCGEKLVVGDNGIPDRDAATGLPEWMRSVQSGGRPAESGAALTPSGGVAAAATLPVQVRRSRVPVLSVNGPARAADTAVTGAPTAEVPPVPVGDVPSARRRGNRLRIVLLVAIILALAIAILAHFAVHGGA